MKINITGVPDACVCGKTLNKKDALWNLKTEIENIKKAEKGAQARSKLNERARKGDLPQEDYQRKWFSIARKHGRKIVGSLSTSGEVICRCGRKYHAKVELEPSVRSFTAITDEVIASLPISEEVFPGLSARMHFDSIDRFKAWVNCEDLNKARAIILECLEKLRSIGHDLHRSIDVHMTSVLKEIETRERKRRHEVMVALREVVREEGGYGSWL